eukprot:c13471_g1_i3 orf=58-504(-)
MDCFILGHPRAHAKLNQAHKSYHCSLHRRSNTANSTLSNKHNGLLTSSIQHWQLNPRLHKESFSANSKFHPATTSSFPAKPILKIRFNMLKSSKNGRLPSSSSRPLPPPSSSSSLLSFHYWRCPVIFAFLKEGQWHLLGKYLMRWFQI